jgi:hypothetical protein
MLTAPLRQHGNDLGFTKPAGLNLEVVTFTLHADAPHSLSTVLQRLETAAVQRGWIGMGAEVNDGGGNYQAEGG